MRKLASYNIAFKGLTEGNHVFDFNIDRSFFELFENSPIDEAEAKVTLLLEKRNGFLAVNLIISGKVRLTCDRCLEEYDQPVENSALIYVKFGEEKPEDDDDIIWLHPEEYQFNVAQLIYEYTILSIPLRHVHPDSGDPSKGCNPEMVKKLDEYQHSPGRQEDDRWNKLKELMKNNIN